MKDPPKLSSLYNLDRLIPREDATEAGHEYLRQIFASDRDYREQMAAIAVESYKQLGRGALIQIWDDLYKGWPTTSGNPDCLTIHDAPSWPQEFPELENDDIIYIPQAQLEPTCEFEIQLVAKISAYNPIQEFVSAFLDRIQLKGGIGTLKIPKTIKQYKGFSVGQSQQKHHQKRKKKK